MTRKDLLDAVRYFLTEYDSTFCFLAAGADEFVECLVFLLALGRGADTGGGSGGWNGCGGG